MPHPAAAVVIAQVAPFLSMTDESDSPNASYRLRSSGRTSSRSASDMTDSGFVCLVGERRLFSGAEFCPRGSVSFGYSLLPLASTHDRDIVRLRWLQDVNLTTLAMRRNSSG